MLLYGSANKIFFFVYYIMPKKLYNILDDNGNEIKGEKRKKKLDAMRRERKKTEPKTEQKTEQKIEQKTDSPVSIIDYGQDIEQPAIIPEQQEPEISITEEELENYIREKEQKNYIPPPVQPQIQQAGIMSNIMNTLITTAIGTITPVVIMMGLQKYAGTSQEQQNQPPTNSSKPTPKANIPKFSPFTGQN